MNSETFYSEWFRVTNLTRKRSIHAQLGEINEAGCRLALTVGERATIAGRDIMSQRRLWVNRGGFDW
jgi:hypothetical protein